MTDKPKTALEIAFVALEDILIGCPAPRIRASDAIRAIRSAPVETLADDAGLAAFLDDIASFKIGIFMADAADILQRIDAYRRERAR